MDCLFCKIINGEIPSRTVYEDSIVKVIMDVNPDNKGHLLVLPKEHSTDISYLPDTTLLHMRDVALKMSYLQNEKLGSTGTQFIINYGDTQAIKHVHMHVLPHNPNDLPLKTEKLTTDEELDEVFKLLTK
jgi:histidine triad (HIT) family protein